MVLKSFHYLLLLFKKIKSLVLAGHRGWLKEEHREWENPLLDNIPEKDEYRLVCTPGLDVFGISDAMQELGSHSESTELYSSPAFLRTRR